MEAAVISGRLASSAITRYPDTRLIPGYCKFKESVLAVQGGTEMQEPKQGNSGSPGGGDGQNRRQGRRRQRTILNLGMPLVQLDDLVNQSEDAIAIGYRVLQKVVEEIKAGYKEAEEFNTKQRKFEEEGGPPPAIPWQQLVDRAQKLQNISLDAMKDGTDVFFDSIKSGMKSVKSAAETWESSRRDVDTNKPSVAGPVFNDAVHMVVRPGEQAEPEFRRIKHRGLARLRIIAQVGALQEVDPTERPFVADKGAKSELAADKKVSFDAIDEETSVLRIDVGRIGESQKTGKYEGNIVAKNFELLIAKLIVTVAAEADRPAPPKSAVATPGSAYFSSTRGSYASVPTKPATSASGASARGAAAVPKPGRPVRPGPKPSSTQGRRRRTAKRAQARNR